MLLALCHVFLCFVPLLIKVDIRVTRSHVCMMLLATPCLDLCVYVFISMIYGWILAVACLYAWVHVLPCLCAMFLHVYVYVYMLICLDLCFHMPMCLDLCSLHAFMPSSMYLCAPCHVCVPRPRRCLSCHLLL